MAREEGYEYAEVPVPLSYGGGDAPSIHRIVDLISNRELSGWRFVQPLHFVGDEKTGLHRPAAIEFRRPKQDKLRTIIFNYMPVTAADDGLVPDSEPGWEKVGMIECDALGHPRTILFRKENHER